MLALLSVQPSWPLTAQPAPRRHLAPAMQVGAGGDLEGGRDESRNAEVSALRKLFYSSDAPSESEASMPDSAGLLLDLPLARWSMVILPHQQTILNVFQPQYTLMFLSLIHISEPTRPY